MSSPAPATKVRWLILALLLAFSFMSWFNRVSMPAAYDERIHKETNISEERIGYVYSAMLFAYMIFMTPGGWFADRRGARLALTAMGLGSAAFVALTGVVGFAGLSSLGLVVALLVVRGALGVFTAPIYPASGRAIAQWLPARWRAWANGAVMSAALVGIAFCFPLFGKLLDAFDWPMAFLISGAVTALLALIWMAVATDTPERHPWVNSAEVALIRADHVEAPAAATDAGDWRAWLNDRSLVLLTLSYASIGYFEYLFYFWMNFYFKEVLKLDKESRNYAMALNLSMAAGMFAGGWLADALGRAWGKRIGRTTVVVGGMLGGAALLGAGLLETEPQRIVVWFALAMAAVGTTEGPFWATALELGGRRGATAAGIFNTGGNAGGVLAPVLTPLVSNAFGWPAGIGLGSVVCVAGASVWFWIKPPQDAESPPGRSLSETASG
jgi:MFS family permease